MAGRSYPRHKFGLQLTLTLTTVCRAIVTKTESIPEMSTRSVAYGIFLADKLSGSDVNDKFAKAERCSMIYIGDYTRKLVIYDLARVSPWR